jgi:hypothetical protein
VNLAERDAYIITQLAAFIARGMTPRQAVVELIRTSGLSNISLVGHDPPALEEDVSGIQTAVSDLTVPAIRTSTTTHPLIGRTSLYPATGALDKKTGWRLRVLAAGA